MENKLHNDLRMKNLFCDAVLWLEDGGIFPVHRFVLCGCIEYFVTLFTTPLHCTEITDILLQGVTSETMSFILQYACMGSVDINQEIVRAFVLATVVCYLFPFCGYA
jgi:kelch-like protein 10